MRSVFAVPCSKCPTTLERGISRSVVIATPYRDGPLYELRCASGHEAVVLLGNPKHEILFQMAAYSLLDGNYHGAIASFASSLEEFWQFSLQVIAASQGVRQLPVERIRVNRRAHFQNRWAEVLKTKAPVLSQEDYELRNRAMHEAYIPSEKEAFDFGDKVLMSVAPAMQRLRWDLQGAVGEASAAIISEAKSRLALGEPTAAIQDATILHDNESMNYRRLADYMSHLRKVDELFRSLSGNSAAGKAYAEVVYSGLPTFKLGFGV